MRSNGPRWRILVSPRAERELKHLSPRDQSRVRVAFDALSDFPGQGDLRKLSGRENEWRLRVGDIRVRFRPNYGDRVIVILHVLPRGRAYRR